MFEVLTCKKPYSDNQDKRHNIVAMYRALKEGIRPLPIPDKPDEVIELVKKCWEFDPKRRPTMEEVLRKLEDIRRLNYFLMIVFKC